MICTRRSSASRCGSHSTGVIGSEAIASCIKTERNFGPVLNLKERQANEHQLFEAQKRRRDLTEVESPKWSPESNSTAATEPKLSAHRERVDRNLDRGPSEPEMSRCQIFCKIAENVSEIASIPCDLSQLTWTSRNDAGPCCLWGNQTPPYPSDLEVFDLRCKVVYLAPANWFRNSILVNFRRGPKAFQPSDSCKIHTLQYFTVVQSDNVNFKFGMRINQRFYFRDNKHWFRWSVRSPRATCSPTHIKDKPISNKSKFRCTARHRKGRLYLNIQLTNKQ